MRNGSVRGLLSSLVLREKIVTTEAKAKFLKREIERLISRSKKLDLAARRRVLALLPEKEAAEKLFERIVPQFLDRVGGYVRVIKLPPRRGDQAPLARVEFVEGIKEKVKTIKPVKSIKSVKVSKTAKRTRPVGAGKPARKTDAKNKSNKGKRS